MTSNIVCISLDDDALKLWRQIPAQSRSAQIREWLLGQKKEKENPKELITQEILAIPSTNSSAEPKLSSNHESHLSGMDHTARQKRRTSSYRKAEDSILAPLLKASS